MLRLFRVTAPYTGLLLYNSQVRHLTSSAVKPIYATWLLLTGHYNFFVVSIIQIHLIYGFVVFSVLNQIIQCVHPSITHCTAVLGLFCELSEFRLIWNTWGVRNRQEGYTKLLLQHVLCHAELLLWLTDTGKEFYWKRERLCLQAWVGLKSRLGCLLLNLHYSFKFGVTGWISVSFCLEYILCNNNLKSSLFTYSLSR